MTFFTLASPPPSTSTITAADIHGHAASKTCIGNHPPPRILRKHIHRQYYAGVWRWYFIFWLICNLSDIFPYFSPWLILICKNQWSLKEDATILKLCNWCIYAWNITILARKKHQRGAKFCSCCSCQAFRQYKREVARSRGWWIWICRKEKVLPKI